jgi:hypothetical protein
LNDRWMVVMDLGLGWIGVRPYGITGRRDSTGETT